MTSIDFHFDYLSPFAYFGWLDARALCARRGWKLVPRPTLFPALLSHWGQLGPAEIPPKRAYVMRSCLRAAARRGVPFVGPAYHPFRPLTSLRVSLREASGDDQFAVIDTLFRAAWSEGADLGDDAAIAAALGDAGLDGEGLVGRARTAPVKNALRAETERAVARDVFGVPTFFAGDELFWGVDSLGDLERFVDGEDTVPADAAARLENMRAGASRKRAVPVDVRTGSPHLQRFQDPVEYLKAVGPLFQETGVVCDMIASVAAQLASGSERYPEWRLAAWMDGGRPKVATLQTPPYAMHITEASDEELWPLVEAFPEVNAIFGPDGTVARFAELSGRAFRIEDRMRLFELRELVEPRAAVGRALPVEEADAPWLGAWLEAFQIEVGETHRSERDAMARRALGRMFKWVLDDGAPVAIAAWAGKTDETARINAVYTPPELRGNGYASNVVAAVTRRLLKGGCTYTTLFTDVRNPTPNSIYQKLGYRPVGDLTKIDFDGGGDHAPG